MASRSRWVALGMSAGAVAGLVAGMAATARPQVTTAPPPPPTVTDEPTVTLPGGAEPAESPFAGRPSITQTGAS
jgi:hypothetical protein